MIHVVLAVCVFVGLLVVFGPGMALFTVGFNQGSALTFFLCFFLAITWMVAACVGVIDVAISAGWITS